MAGFSIPPDDERCQWIKGSGRRCKQRKSGDSDRCDFHDTMFVERARRATLATQTTDIPVDQHLQMELRMSFVMVRMLELEVHDLGLDSEAWIFDEVETETREGGPGGGFESVRRKKVIAQHPILAQYLVERRHHMEVIKLCVAAGLAARQIAAVERIVESIMTAQMLLAEALGHDPTEPAVRSAIMQSLQKAEAIMGQTPPKQALG